MTEQRISEIVAALMGIADAFVPSEDEPELTMFGLISRYNAQYPNPELIGGDWVVEHVPELANLTP